MEDLVSLYAVEIDGEWWILEDQALGKMIQENGWGIKDIAQRFMISVEDAKEILCAR